MNKQNVINGIILALATVGIVQAESTETKFLREINRHTEGVYRATLYQQELTKKVEARLSEVLREIKELRGVR